MKELQNLMSIGDVAKSFGVCVATVRPVSYTHLDVYKRQVV